MCWQRRAGGPERIVIAEIGELVVRLQRRDRHPVERKQEHEDEDRERQIDRHEAAAAGGSR